MRQIPILNEADTFESETSVRNVKCCTTNNWTLFNRFGKEKEEESMNEASIEWQTTGEPKNHFLWNSDSKSW